MSSSPPDLTLVHNAAAEPPAEPRPLAPPLVSVIIPCRNAASWLPRSLASIGWTDAVEVVVVDDGSTDGTADMLAALAAKEPRIVVVPGPCKGPGAARNRGIAVACAPFVAFLDADDRWRMDKLELQLALHVATPELGFSFTDYRHVTGSGEDRGGCFAYWRHFGMRHAGKAGAFLLGRDALAQLYAENVVGTSTVIARTDLLRAVGGFDETLGQTEDWDLWLRLAARAPVGCIPRVLMDYTMHRAGNLSGNQAVRVQAMGLTASRHREAAHAQRPAAVRICKARMAVAEAELAEKQGHWWRAAYLRANACRRDLSWRALRECAAALRQAVRLPARVALRMRMA
jgi:glycosyltransferase involved in cell wall biosynthesis